MSSRSMVLMDLLYTTSSRLHKGFPQTEGKRRREERRRRAPANGFVRALLFSEKETALTAQKTTLPQEGASQGSVSFLFAYERIDRTGQQRYHKKTGVRGDHDEADI